MADFKRAFNKGLKASTSAELRKAEIFGVLDDFAAQVKEASDGVLEVIRSRLLKEKPPLFEPYPGVEATTEHDALVALVADIKGKAVPSAVLCEYKLAAFGYPVTLTYGDNDVVCDDRVSLEHEMENLLSAPSTGTELRRLLKKYEDRRPKPLAHPAPTSSATRSSRPAKAPAAAAGKSRRH